MCFVTITQYIWLFLGQNPAFKSSFRTDAIYIELSDFYIGYTPSVGKPKYEQEIFGMCTYFRDVMETCFE